MNSMLELRTNLKTTLQQLLPEAFVADVTDQKDTQTQGSPSILQTMVTFAARADDTLTIGIGAFDDGQTHRDAPIICERLTKTGIPLSDGTLMCFSILEAEFQPSKIPGCNAYLIDFDLIPLIEARLAA